MTDRNDNPAVALGPRIVASGGFTALYREGMALIEEVAAYLDGDGRTQSRGLPREASFVYATESMRLTTRLMQLASWLLLQRAVNEGELTFDQARTEKMKVKLSPFPALAPDVLELLPKKLCVLISDSRRLHDQVLRLDALVYGGGSILPAETPSASNPVESQLGLLKAAFGQDR